MKPIKNVTLKSVRVMTALAVLSASITARASSLPDVPWSQVCQAARGGEMIATTVSGETVEGYCASVDVNEIAIRTKDNRVVKVARTALARLRVRRPKDHPLRELGESMRGALSFNFGSLSSPWAPVALVMIPATLAYGAIAAPFCLIGDLKARITHSYEREVKPY